VDYANDRGIVILPEIDTPGHTASMGQYNRSLIADCWAWIKEVNGATSWPYWSAIALDPTKNSTFEFVSNLVSELAPLFPLPYFHIGGDEVQFGCWANAVGSNISLWMQQNGFAVNESGNWTYNYAGLQNYWTGKMQDLVKSLNKSSVIWEEAFLHGAPLLNDTVVAVWLNPNTIQRVLEAGKKVMTAWGWYVDRQAPLCMDPQSICPTHYMWIWTWKDFYTIDPLNGLTLTPEQQLLFLGGAGSSWGESVDGANVDDRIWSRGPAFSERLWSPAAVNDTNQAQPRLSAFRCHLARRGVRSGPTEPAFCDLTSILDPTPVPCPDESKPRTYKIEFIVMIAICVVLLLLNVVQFLSKRRSAEDDAYRQTKD